MITLLVGRNGKSTCAFMQERLGATVFGRYFLQGGKIPWRINGQKQRRGFVPSVEGQHVIRWACATPLPGTPCLEVQPRQGILNASNKPLARQMLQEAGVPVPMTTTNRREAQAWVDSGKVIVVRPRTHHAGIGFQVVNPGEEVPVGGYFSILYKKTKEFRVHVGHGYVLSLQEKVRSDGAETRPDVPWNHATGNFVFEVCKWSQWRLDVARAGIAAIETLGLDYGAVDVLADEEGNPVTAVVTEVNTSPGMADYMLEKYAKYFLAVIGGMEKRLASEPIVSWRDIVFRPEETV